MYMAYIGGWNEVIAFSNDQKTAEKLAVSKKKSTCRDDLDKWTWETVREYYGAYSIPVNDGDVHEL